MTTAELVLTPLTVGGMTCVACANRIERKLNRIDGVRATVNFATATATVTHPPSLPVTDLVATVVAMGYTAHPPQPDRPVSAGEHTDAALRRRLVIAAALTAPVLAISMVPAWQFAWWQWVVAGLTGPVVGWAGWPFHRAAASTPDTAPPPWTHSSRLARWCPTSGVCGRSWPPPLASRV